MDHFNIPRMQKSTGGFENKKKTIVNQKAFILNAYDRLKKHFKKIKLGDSHRSDGDLCPRLPPENDLRGQLFSSRRSHTRASSESLMPSMTSAAPEPAM